MGNKNYGSGFVFSIYCKPVFRGHFDEGTLLPRGQFMRAHFCPGDNS